MRKTFYCITIVLITSLLILETPIRTTAASTSKTPWYQVADWEVDVCSKWGGLGLARQGATPDKSISLGIMTFTVQARKSPTANATLYEIGAYLDSVDPNTPYSLRLVNTLTGSEYSLRKGTQSILQDYIVEELKEEYTHVLLNTVRGKVLFPIVAKQ